MTDLPYTYKMSPPTPMRWMDQALCAEVGPGPFYPERPAPGAAADHRRALMICARCPVQLDCLRHALEHDERYGVWGGTTEEQRGQMRRLSKRPKETA